MNISPGQRRELLDAIAASLEAVAAERERGANDFSEKWSDAREARARALDQKRDDLLQLQEGLSRPSGQLLW